MAVLTQNVQAGEFLLSEANGERSREQVTVTVAGAIALPSGTLLGKVSASGKYVKYDEAGTDDGRRVAAGVLLTPLPGVNGDHRAVVFVRDCEVSTEMLTFDDANGLADLKTLGVVAR